MTENTPQSSQNLFADVLKAKATAGEAGPATEPVAPVEPDEEPEVTQAPNELDMLKARAKLMGISHSPNIGVEALKAKIKAKLDGETPAEVEPDEDQDLEEDIKHLPIAAVEGNEPDHRDEEIAALKAKIAALTSVTQTNEALIAPVQTKAASRITAKNHLRQQQHAEQMKLIRVRITNLNPNKKDLPGEIFTFANKVLGAVRKFVPYGEATENGYHIPFCIYTQLKEREFLNIKTRKDSRGRQIVETSMAREFALEVLPPLTERELAALAASQAAAKGMD